MHRCQHWDFSYPDRILVGFRDFEAKSGQSRRNRDGWTVWLSMICGQKMYHAPSTKIFGSSAVAITKYTNTQQFSIMKILRNRSNDVKMFKTSHEPQRVVGGISVGLQKNMNNGKLLAIYLLFLTITLNNIFVYIVFINVIYQELLSLL